MTTDGSASEATEEAASFEPTKCTGEGHHTVHEMDGESSHRCEFNPPTLQIVGASHTDDKSPGLATRVAGTLD